MTNILELTGFGGVRLAGEVVGADTDPAVLLVHGAGQSRANWEQVAKALVAAGRRVISIDLRGHGASEWPADGRYDYDAFVGDLRAVLSQLGSRPVVVASTSGGWFAAGALATDAANLAAGLVVVDLPTDLDPATTQKVSERLLSRAGAAGATPWDPRWLDAFDPTVIPATLADAAPKISIPVLLVRSGRSDLHSKEATQALSDALPDAEVADMDDVVQVLDEPRLDAFNAILLDFLERRQPRNPPEYRSGSDARTLRDALGCFATGVTIVTATGPDGLPIGLTANSFTSVSLDPPLLLVCIANGAGSAAALRAADRFAVNVLQIGQQPASNRFAGKGVDRFADTDWAMGENGSPVLDGSLGTFECERFSVTDAGDHFILVGQVIKATFEPRRDPLLYFRGRYRRLHFA